MDVWRSVQLEGTAQAEACRHLPGMLWNSPEATVSGAEWTMESCWPAAERGGSGLCRAS